MSVTIYRDRVQRTGNDITHNQTEKQNKNPKIVNAKELHLGAPIDAKKELAKKQAMKLIGDAWGREKKVSQSITDMMNAKKEKLDEMNELKRKLNDIDLLKEKYREEYGIDPDSQEQKDLELLEKYQNNKYGNSFDRFSEEEIERLKELQEKPLTEYQEKSLQANYSKIAVQGECEKLRQEIVGISQAISDGVIEQEKSQDMLKAQDAAKQLLQAANQEILGELFEEGRNHVDEEHKKEEEKADKLKEEKEEKEQRLEKEQDQRLEKDQSRKQEEILDAGSDAEQLKMNVQGDKVSNSQVEQAQKSIQKILIDNNMMNEDIKGIEIDLKF